MIIYRSSEGVHDIMFIVIWNSLYKPSSNSGENLFAVHFILMLLEKA